MFSKQPYEQPYLDRCLIEFGKNLCHFNLDINKTIIYFLEKDLSNFNRYDSYIYVSRYEKSSVYINVVALNRYTISKFRLMFLFYTTYCRIEMDQSDNSFFCQLTMHLPL